MLQAVKTSRRNRCKSKSRARRYESTQKPSGTISRRVQKVGGEHFAIACVDPAKHTRQLANCRSCGQADSPPHRSNLTKWSPEVAK